jgi:hypothetical protein
MNTETTKNIILPTVTQETRIARLSCRIYDGPTLEMLAASFVGYALDRPRRVTFSCEVDAKQDEFASALFKLRIRVTLLRHSELSPRAVYVFGILVQPNAHHPLFREFTFSEEVLYQPETKTGIFELARRTG